MRCGHAYDSRGVLRANEAGGGEDVLRESAVLQGKTFLLVIRCFRCDLLEALTNFTPNFLIEVFYCGLYYYEQSVLVRITQAGLYTPIGALTTP